MNVLAIDIGSSSVKAAILRGPGEPKRQARVGFDTTFEGGRAEVRFDHIAAAVGSAITKLGPAAQRVDLIVPTGMAPSWLALDRRGRAITPVVTHQDRRSVEQARAIERRVGKGRHLTIAGNRPFPGGISSTTAAWFMENAPARMRRADLVGHLNTALLRCWCGVRAIDASNASFTGLYRTGDFGGWSAELCEAAGVRRSLLPDVYDANAIAGTVTADAADAWQLREGTPVLAGVMDGSCAMLLGNDRTLPRNGQLVNVMGSTDVLAAANDLYRPHEAVLTRALGLGRGYLSVVTIAAAGSAIDWLGRTFFGELSIANFYDRFAKLGPAPGADPTFDARLAGSRHTIEPPTASLSNLTLATTRDAVARAMLADLSRASAARLAVLESLGLRLRPDVITTGGGAALAKALHRDWPRRYRFSEQREATLRGLWRLAEQAI